MSTITKEALQQLLEKCITIAVDEAQIDIALSAESRDLFGNERRFPPISPDAVRAYTAIQRTQAIQVIQVIQVTQTIQTSLKTH